jgi:salicylate hydroxylase
VRLIEGWSKDEKSVPLRIQGDVIDASCKLDIVVVGCGLAGLSTAYCLGKAGHRVTILEAASGCSEVGAGIQLAPNASRILINWGLKNSLDALGVKPESVSFRRFDTGERIGMDFLGHKLEKEHGAPYYQIHRADLHQLLYNLAAPYVNIRFSSRVASVSPDPPSPYVILTTGEVISCDLIIGADGVKSSIRRCMVDGPDSPTPTGDAAYRATISTELLLKDPELKPFVDTAEGTCWMGPGMHVFGYCLRGKKMYNLVMLHPDTGSATSTESWTGPGDVDEMLRAYEGWDPRLRKMQSMAASVLRSRLMARLPLKTWVHDGGCVALIGDACHPMLPYRAQGAAISIEDAAVLGYLFSQITSKSQIPALLKAYEALCYDRASKMQLTSLSLQKVFHWSDGPEQQQRDGAMREAMELTLKEARGEAVARDAFRGNSNAWLDKAKTKAVYGYNAEKVVEEWWTQNGSSTLGFSE